MENSTSESTVNAAIEQPTIAVTLCMNSGGNEILRFDGAPEELDIDFTRSDQTSLRKLFRWLLDKQLKQRAKLKLVKEASVKNPTYQKVAEDYISDLNAELDSIFLNEERTIEDLTSTVNVMSGKDNEGEDA